MRAVLLLGVLLAVPVAQLSAQPLDAEELSVQSFLQAVEAAISTSDRNRWTDLLSPNADREQSLEFFDAIVPQGLTRVVVKERDRAPLVGSLPGEGYRLLAEVFMETGPRGRIFTWRLDIRRPRGGDDRQPWRIVGQDRLSAIEGLHRLALHPEKQYAARALEITAVDYQLRVPEGQVFVAETPEGVTAMVVLGEGTMTFAPSPKEEKGQVRLFGGAETLEAPFTAAFIRLNPFEFEKRLALKTLTAEPVEPRLLRRAQAMFDDEVAKSFSLDLSDLSRDTWSLLPQPGDFVSEVRTRRFDMLTYARSVGEAEDVTLFQRRTKRNIAVYASEQKLASRGQFYDEDDLVEYDVTDYNVDTTFHPDREWIEGRARLSLRVKAFALATFSLRLHEAMTVSSVTSDELGRLMFLRVRNQNAIVVNLPSPVARDYPLTLTVAFQGRAVPQKVAEDSVSVEADLQRGSDRQLEDLPIVPPEPNWLFSNRSPWYPQGQVSDYATATMRVTVPSEYDVVATGVQLSGSPAISGAAPNGTGGRATFVFMARQPVRYLSMVVSRMAPVDAATVALDIVPPARTDGAAGRPVKPELPPVGARNTIQLSITANKRQESRARDTLMVAADILRLYASIVGDVPYDALTVAMVESTLPGGHAPGFFAVMNNPLPTTPYTWRNDPASFQNFPEFFVAHELAHQWFGQAVGWQNYHEQWLSEGFAQYFAALFAKERRGEQAFRDVLRQFRRWAMDESDQGPVYLGYRLGHIKGESKVFRALVYNKGAAVLHMLRRLLGDEAFFRGLRKFYAENRFAKAGTNDLQRAMESESGRDLGRFFRQWIFDVGLPRLRFSSAVDGQDLIVRVDQVGDVFDVPVTVTIQYADGRVAEEVIAVTEAQVQRRIAINGAIRSVEVNQDNATLGTIEKVAGR
jgi:hypothetical protein